MKTYLGKTPTELSMLDAIHTAQEIVQQPVIWETIYSFIKEQNEALTNFINSASDCNKVILTGAGTSAYIGESLVGEWSKNINTNTVAIPTTHLVSHPTDYIRPNDNLLLVSFARSGNSPESLATVELADKLAKTCKHLIITCNENGALTKYKSASKKFVFHLPKEANDKSLAMTSSYSGMLLSGLLIAKITEIDKLQPQIQALKEYGNNILENYVPLLQEISFLPFKRVVFLGSGPLNGAANESQLKVQEMTDGEIICKHDSFLGLRHGPKAVIDNETLLVYLFSNSPHVSKYENDLVFSMDKGKKALAKVGVFEIEDYQFPIEHNIYLSKGNTKQIEESFLPIVMILPGQILAFFKSIDVGCKPDNPSKSGAIHRVVQGVNIYNI